MFKLNSMKAVISISVILVILVIIFPMKTSLGQGIDEYVISSWQGTFDPNSQTYKLRIEYIDGKYTEIPMNALAVDQFSIHTSNLLWMTPKNFPAALKAAFQKNPTKLKNALGTHANVAGFMRPFPGEPVAYTSIFLKSLDKLHINLKDYGGPNIPPGSVPYEKLQKDMLQIDTMKNSNSLYQCKPGETPYPLLLLNSNISN